MLRGKVDLSGSSVRCAGRRARAFAWRHWSAGSSSWKCEGSEEAKTGTGSCGAHILPHPHSIQRLFFRIFFGSSRRRAPALVVISARGSGVGNPRLTRPFEFPATSNKRDPSRPTPRARLGVGFDSASSSSCGPSCGGADSDSSDFDFWAGNSIV